MLERAYIVLRMLEVSSPVLGDATPQGGTEYERIVGIESRVDLSASSSASVSSNAERTGPWSTDILIASCDGTSTKLFALSCSFGANGIVHRGERKLLVSLKERCDIIQASCSDLGPQKETIVSFTRRGPVQSGTSATRRDSGMSRSTADARPSSVHPQSSNQHEHQLWLHVVGTDEWKEMTVRDPLLPGAAPSAIRSEYQCQSGYMLRRKSPKDNIFWLRACDYTANGLQIKEIIFNKKGKMEVRSVLEWNLAQMQLFHHWDPFTQRLTYLIDRPPDDLRIVKFFGHPEHRRCEFNYVSRMKRSLYPGRPRELPWCTATSSNNSSYHKTILPIRYECEDNDYAVCRQHLPPPDGSVKTLARIFCEITLLRNMFDRVEVHIELERPVPLQHGRVAFLFVHGLIAIYLPGVFVHYVDVHHKDIEPRYLFGVSLKGVWSLPVSPRNGAPRGTSPSTAHGMSLGTNASSGSGNSNRSPLGSHCVPNSASRDVVALPIPGGNWIAVPNTIHVHHVSLTKAKLWEYIADRLTSLSCTHQLSSPCGPREESLILQHALHVVTAHFQFDGSSSRCSSSNSLFQSGPMSAPTAGEDHFAFHLKEVFRHHWREVKPAFFTQLLLGEAYRATRALAKANGNPYYQFLSMTDDRHQHQLLDDLRTSKESQQRQRARSTAGGGGTTQSQAPPQSPRSTTAAPNLGSANLGSTNFGGDEPQTPHVGNGCGGYARATSFRNTDDKLKDVSVSNTYDGWWIVRGIKLSFTIRGFVFRKNTHLIVRIPIADARQLFSNGKSQQATSGAASNSGKFKGGSSTAVATGPALLHDIIKHRLAGVGVPDAQANQVSILYEQEVTKLIDDIIQVVTKCGEGELPARAQFYLLNHLILAVHSIGQRLTSDLSERFAQLAASSLPQVAVLCGMKSGLYAPAISSLDYLYCDLHNQIVRSKVRFGQKLTDRDHASALKTARIPFTVASPEMLDFIRVRECGGCPSIFSAAADGTLQSPILVSPPSARSDIRNTFAMIESSGRVTMETALRFAPNGTDRRRLHDSRKLPRYHSVPSGSQSTRYLPAMPTLEEFHKWTAMNCASSASGGHSDHAKDAKEFVMCAYELGPTLQCSTSKALPKDAVTRQNGGSLHAFIPWAKWNSGRDTTLPTPPARAQPLLGAASSQPSVAGLVPAYFHASDTIRKERAREALQYAFVPFATLPTE